MKDQIEMFLETVEERISAALAGPHMFFFVREAAETLMLSVPQIRWAIRRYRLDSLLIGNQHRIPRSAIVRFWECRREIKRQEIGYLIYAKRQELLAPEPRPRIGSSLTSAAFRSDDCTAAIEDVPMDWYDLGSLPLPDVATTEEWGRLLRSPAHYLVRDLGVSRKDPVDWPTIYDWLISREMVNLPVGADFDVPEDLTMPRKSTPTPSSYQMLFEEFL